MKDITEMLNLIMSVGFVLTLFSIVRFLMITYVIKCIVHTFHKESRETYSFKKHCDHNLAIMDDDY